MKQAFRTILILFLVLIVISGLLLFMFRQQAADSLSSQANFGANSNYASSTKIQAGETLNVDLLKLAQFTALVNNVINFDFDNICKRPSDGTVVVKTKTETIATGTELATSTERKITPINCVKGNNSPFLVNKK